MWVRITRGGLLDVALFDRGDELAVLTVAADTHFGMVVLDVLQRSQRWAMEGFGSMTMALL